MGNGTNQGLNDVLNVFCLFFGYLFTGRKYDNLLFLIPKYFGQVHDGHKLLALMKLQITSTLANLKIGSLKRQYSMCLTKERGISQELIYHSLT